MGHEENLKSFAENWKSWPKCLGVPKYGFQKIVLQTDAEAPVWIWI